MPAAGKAIENSRELLKDLATVLGGHALDGSVVVVRKTVHFEEVVGEAAGDDGEKQASRGRADVAKGVRNIARARGDGASRRRNRLAANCDLELPFQNVEDL